LSDLIGLVERQARYVSPSGPASGYGSRDMDMNMRYGLIGGDSVVLPHRNSLWVKRIPNGRGSTDRGVHQRIGFFSREIEHGHPMLHRDSQNVPQAALLERHEQRYNRTVFKHRVTPMPH
jgi:hypothetical protein